LREPLIVGRRSDRTKKTTNIHGVRSTATMCSANHEARVRTRISKSRRDQPSGGNGRHKRLHRGKQLEGALELGIEIKGLPQMRFEKRGKRERIIQCINWVAAKRVAQGRLEPAGCRCVRQHLHDRRIGRVCELSGSAHRALPFWQPVVWARSAIVPKELARPAGSIRRSRL